VAFCGPADAAGVTKRASVNPSVNANRERRSELGNTCSSLPRLPHAAR
jgi:hypothetical protein